MINIFKNKKYSAVLVVLIGVLALVQIAQAQKKTPVPQLFYKANEFFEKSDYPQAKQAYKQIIDSGISSGNIYYNLGNTYFKLGQLGKAIVNYERAKILLPQDGDVKANLEYALSLCNNPVIPAKENWIIGIGKKIADDFTLDDWTRALSTVYIILLIAAGLFVVIKLPILKKTVISISVVFFLIAFVWAIKFHDLALIQKAIVIKSEADCRFAPSNEAVVHFKTFEGAKLQVIDENSRWFRIKTPDGKIGWLLQSEIEVI